MQIVSSQGSASHEERDSGPFNDAPAPAVLNEARSAPGINSDQVDERLFDNIAANAKAPRWKQWIDIPLAMLGLLLLAPLFCLVAVYIKWASPGPVFFFHRRFGLAGRPFDVWKFRTMPATTDPREHANYVQSLVRENATLAKNRADVLIPLGGVLRDLAIDELPQLINVLLGEMSLVGPRPDVVDPTTLNAHQQQRFKVLPGLTGLWQISGKNSTTFDEMIALDVEYVSRQNPWLDLYIICMTPRQLIAQFFSQSPKEVKQKLTDADL